MKNPMDNPEFARFIIWVGVPFLCLILAVIAGALLTSL